MTPAETAETAAVVVDTGLGGIEVRGLEVSYEHGPVLVGVDFAVLPGHLCGLVGMNGAGKSTLFKALAGVVRPDRGTITLDRRPAAAARASGLVGYVPQREEIDWTFPITVRDAVMMGRYGFQGWTRRPRREDREAVAEAIDRVELSELADRQIGQLSGGQRKRAFVARGLAQHAKIMLLDEPFAGVDKRSERTIAEVLRQMSDGGTTVLVASHDLHALPRLCDEAVLINRTVIDHGPIDEMLVPELLARAFGLTGDDLERSEELVR